MGHWLHRAQIRAGVFVLVVMLLVLGEPPAATTLAAEPHQQLCHLVLNDQRMPSVAVERGFLYHQDFWIDLNHCTFTAGPISRHAISGPLASPDGGTLTSMSQHFGDRLSGSDPNIFSREETWDCCGNETTYVEDRQTYSSDGTNAYVSFLQTLTWTLNDGWYITSGPSQWFNTPNPNSSVSTESTAAFDNTTFPCGCQPCDHQLWAELRSYADGTWTPSTAFTGDPGQTICSGWIHVSQDSGSW